MSNTETTSSRRKSRAAAPLGAVFIILAIIGLITVLGTCVSFTAKLLDNTGKKEEIGEFLKPVVLFDPVPFSSVSEVDPMVIKRAAIWAALFDKDTQSLEYDDQRRVKVTASDVDVWAARLFGEGTTVTHETFSDYFLQYEYVEESQAYYVPATSITDYYSPIVESITKKNGLYEVRVGYVAPGPLFGSDNREDAKPDKYMIYTLEKDKQGYHIVSLAFDTQASGSNDFSGLYQGSSSESSQEESSQESTSEGSSSESSEDTSEQSSQAA